MPTRLNNILNQIPLALNNMSLQSLANKILERSKIFLEVQKACHYLLNTHPLAAPTKNYVNERMSVLSQEKFNVGWFPDNENLNALYSLVSEEKIKKLGLVYPFHVQNGDHRVFIDNGLLCNHNLTIPYYDINGNIVALVGRTTLSEIERKSAGLQKYKYTPFQKSLHLFGIQHAKKAIIKLKSAIIVEGQIDCITCHEYGIENVVALGGTSFGKHQRDLLGWFAAKFKLLLDNDKEGNRAQIRIIDRYSKKININCIKVPDNFKDVDQYLRSGDNVSSITDYI